MEIAPIPGIRAFTAARSPQTEMRAPEIFNIDGSSRPGDDAEQGSERNATGAEKNTEADPAPESETSVDGVEMEEAPAKEVDYFA